MKQHRGLVAGEWLTAAAANRVIHDPATGKPVSCVPDMGAEQVAAAVASARHALQSSEWSCNGRLRADVLLEWADRVAKNIEPLAERLTCENGKLLGESRFEIGNQVNVIRYNAGLARTVSGRSHALGSHAMAVVTREPIGVVAVISPWNWPIALMVRDMAPALAAGNAVLCKPASQTAGVALEFLKHLADCAELPEGILNMLTGAGSVVGQAMVESTDIDMIAFTGDGSTGRRIVRDSADSLKKIALELGGKSPYIVCADANLDKAVPELVSAVFTTTSGQICTAPSRLVVEKSIRADVVRRLTDAIAGIKIGNGFDPDSQMGPLSTAEQFAKVQQYIEQGRNDACLIAGGDVPDRAELGGGYFVGPAIFSDVNPESPLARDEIFGPVLVLQEFSDDDEAIYIANDTMFGLAAAVFTENVHRAWSLSRAIMAGTVWVNTYNRFYAETEVGGYKTSGIGRMAGIDGLQEFTQTKHINFDSTPPASAAGRVR